MKGIKMNSIYDEVTETRISVLERQVSDLTSRVSENNVLSNHIKVLTSQLNAMGRHVDRLDADISTITTHVDDFLDSLGS